ncbi:hypothetical protein IIA79_08560 [bacterium]|nr:hypothetical protein [bacterium]
MKAMLEIAGEAVAVSVVLQEGGKASVRLDGEEYSLQDVVRDGDLLVLSFEGRKYSFSVLNLPDGVQLTDGRGYYTFRRIEEGATAGLEASQGSLTSQMPGTVLKLLVEPGARVAKGTPLLILEAMKMEHEILAPADGTVSGFLYENGQRVMPGDLLVEFIPAES